ncbi:hypothetical protein GQX74_013606 [Glossina fuscipes]|nr:hypothetical protein GQX74_013606 [Glossina fuscipes]
MLNDENDNNSRSQTNLMWNSFIAFSFYLQPQHIIYVVVGRGGVYSNADKRSARLHGCCTRCARWPKDAKDANDEDDHLVAVNAVLQLNQSIDISCNDNTLKDIL